VWWPLLLLLAYNDALRATFYLATALACCTIFGALAMEWKSVKEGEQKPAAPQDEEKQTQKA